VEASAGRSLELWGMKAWAGNGMAAWAPPFHWDCMFPAILRHRTAAHTDTKSRPESQPGHSQAWSTDHSNAQRSTQRPQAVQKTRETHGGPRCRSNAATHQVLDEVLDVEPGLEVAPCDARPQLVDGEGASSPRSHSVNDLQWVEASPAGKDTQREGGKRGGDRCTNLPFRRPSTCATLRHSRSQRSMMIQRKATWSQPVAFQTRGASSPPRDSLVRVQHALNDAHHVGGN
jgi:hypothetical protein